MNRSPRIKKVRREGSRGRDNEDIEELKELEPRKRSGREKGEEEDEAKSIPFWMQMRENLDVDKIAHKVMSGERLNPEEILASVGAEIVQRCTGIKKWEYASGF